MSNDSQKRGLWQSPIMLFIAVGMSISTSPHLFGATVVFIILASLAFSIASVLIAVSLTGSNIAKSHMWHTLQRNCQSESIVHKSIAFYILGWKRVIDTVLCRRRHNTSEREPFSRNLLHAATPRQATQLPKKSRSQVETNIKSGTSAFPQPNKLRVPLPRRPKKVFSDSDDASLSPTVATDPTISSDNPEDPPSHTGQYDRSETVAPPDEQRDAEPSKTSIRHEDQREPCRVANTESVQHLQPSLLAEMQKLRSQPFEPTMASSKNLTNALLDDDNLTSFVKEESNNGRDCAPSSEADAAKHYEQGVAAKELEMEKQKNVILREALEQMHQATESVSVDDIFKGHMFSPDPTEEAEQKLALATTHIQDLEKAATSMRIRLIKAQKLQALERNRVDVLTEEVRQAHDLKETEARKLHEVQERCFKMENSMALHKEEAIGLQQKLTEMERHVMAEKDRNEELLRLIEREEIKSRNEIQSLTSKNKELETGRATALELVAKLEKEIEEFKTLNIDLESKVATLEEQVLVFEESAQSQDLTTKELNAKIEKMQTERVALASELTKNASQIQSLKAENQSLEHALESNKAQVTSLEEDLAASKLELQEREKLLQEQKMSHGAVESKLQDLESTHNTLMIQSQQERSALNEQLTHALENLTTSNSELDKCTQHLVSTQEENSQLKGSLQKEQDETCALREKIDGLNSQLEELHEQLLAKASRTVEFNEIEESLRKEIAAASTKAAAAAAAYEQEKAELLQTSEEIKSDLESKVALIHDMEAQLKCIAETASIRENALETEKTELQQQLDNLHADLSTESALRLSVEEKLAALTKDQDIQEVAVLERITSLQEEVATKDTLLACAKENLASVDEAKKQLEAQCNQERERTLELEEQREQLAMQIESLKKEIEMKQSHLDESKAEMVRLVDAEKKLMETLQLEQDCSKELKIKQAQLLEELEIATKTMKQLEMQNDNHKMLLDDARQELLSARSELVVLQNESIEQQNNNQYANDRLRQEKEDALSRLQAERQKVADLLNKYQSSKADQAESEASEMERTRKLEFTRTMLALKDEIMLKMEERTINLEQENLSLRTDLSGLEESYSDLSHTFETLQQENSDVISQAESTRATFESERNQTSALYESERQKNTELQAQYQQMQEQRMEVDRALVKSSEQIQFCRLMLELKDGQIIKLEKNCELVENENHTLTSNLKKMQKEQTELGILIKSINSKFEAEQEKSGSLIKAEQEKYSKLLAKDKKSQELLLEEQSAHMVSKSQIQFGRVLLEMRGSLVNKLENTIMILEGENATVQSNLRTAQEECFELSRKVENSKTKYESEQAEVLSQLEAEQEQSNRLRSEYHELQNLYTEEKRAHFDCRQKMLFGCTLLELLTKALSKSETIVENLEAKSRAMAYNLEEQKSELNRVQEQLATTETTLAASEEIVEQLKQQTTVMDEDLKQERAKTAELEQNVRKMKQNAEFEASKSNSLLKAETRRAEELDKHLKEERKRIKNLELQQGRNKIMLESQVNAVKEAEHTQERLEEALTLERQRNEQLKKSLKSTEDDLSLAQANVEDVKMEIMDKLKYATHLESQLSCFQAVRQELVRVGLGIKQRDLLLIAMLEALSKTKTRASKASVDKLKAFVNDLSKKTGLSFSDECKDKGEGAIVPFDNSKFRRLGLGLGLTLPLVPLVAMVHNGPKDSALLTEPILAMLGMSSR